MKEVSLAKLDKNTDPYKWKRGEPVRLDQFAFLTNYYFTVLNLNKICLFHFQGYVEHVISTSGEWVLAIVLSSLVLTFLNDYKRASVQRPLVVDAISMTILGMAGPAVEEPTMD